MISIPRLDLASIHSSVLGVIRYIKTFPRFAVVEATLQSSASSTASITVSSVKVPRLLGIIQISGTAPEQPSVAMTGTDTATLTYSFGANTTGRQEYKYLLIGE
jgi:hypothetical protein